MANKRVWGRVERYMRIPIAIVVLLGCLSLPAFARKGPRWAHTHSPYRAAFKITGQPNDDEAGYFLAVPICGLGDADGANVFVYNAAGRPQQVLALGRTRNNCALVAAGGKHQNGDILYAYWGTTTKARQSGSIVPGLTVDIRTGKTNGNIDDWRASRRIIRTSRRIGIVPISRIELAANPIDATDAIVMEFNGHILAEKAETWHFFLANDDAGYLFVENRNNPLIERNGRHWAHDDRHGKDRQSHRLRQGRNPIRCVVIDVGGNQMAVLARWVDDRKKFVIPAKSYVHSGTTALTGVETKSGEKECPAFSVTLRDYIGIRPYVFTRYLLRTYDGAEVTWKIGNGMRGKSRTFEQIVVGTDSLAVTAVAADGAEAKGLIQLGHIPRRISWRHWPTYREYSDIMTAQGVDNLNAKYRQAFLHFLNLRERNPDATAICEALLKDKDLGRAEREKILLNLARCAAFREPETSRQAYRKLLQRQKDEALALEYFELELYRLQDAEAAAEALAKVATAGGKDSADQQRCQALLELMTGKPETAKDLLEKHRAALVAKSHATHAVRANNLLSSFKQHVRTGYYEQAEAALREWVKLQPDALLSGHYALMRGRYLRRIGWHQGAHDLLNKTADLNALAPFLPDMEFERAMALRSLKKPNEAKAVFNRIIKDYPNHPVAERAREELAK